MTPDSIRVLIMAVLVSLGIDTTPRSTGDLVAWSVFIGDTNYANIYDFAAVAESLAVIQDTLAMPGDFMQHTVPEHRRALRIDTLDMNAPVLVYPVYVPDYRIDTIWSDEVLPK